MEDVIIDVFYWFEKSSKRKRKLAEYFEFRDQEYQKILKHISVRWLSLERCIDRVLKKRPSFKSYFDYSEHFADARFQRLHAAFSNPVLEPVLLFHSSFIQLFTNFNKLLQREEPTIHILQDAMLNLAKKLATRIVLPTVLKDQAVTEIDLEHDEIFKPKSQIFMGGLTKSTLLKLLNGDVCQQTHEKIFDAAHCYLKYALKYIQQKFPLNNDLLANARWINVSKRIESKWEKVEYFLERFSNLLIDLPHDTLFDEFIDYQTLTDNDIGKAAW